MDFAPYQSSPPEHSRVASPEFAAAAAASPRPPYETAGRRSFSPSAFVNTKTPPPLQHPQPQRAWGGDLDDQAQAGIWVGGGGSAMPGAYPAAEVSEFDTSLGLRLEHEASLAYLALPPLGAIILLILERKSDYVR